MFNPFASLLCLKLCWNNQCGPTWSTSKSLKDHALLLDLQELANPSSPDAVLPCVHFTYAHQL